MSQPTPGDELTTVVDIVDLLEELLGSARRLPFTPSVVVNEEEILELVDRIRVALPDDLVSARHTLDERDQILARAEREVAEVTSRAEVDAIAKRGQAEGCLAWPPTEMPPPIGYICALTDPDGNMIEFSYDQGVYATVQEVWGNGS